MFQTAFNRKKTISAESYKGVKSITEPEQVLPLKKIIQGLKNGTILLPERPQHYDIPEQEIDVKVGRSPESTNANIASATADFLVSSADRAGEIITAAPGFQPEDAHNLIDSVESSLSKQILEAASASVAEASAASEATAAEAKAE